MWKSPTVATATRIDPVARGGGIPAAVSKLPLIARRLESPRYSQASA